MVDFVGVTAAACLLEDCFFLGAALAWFVADNSIVMMVSVKNIVRAMYEPNSICVEFDAWVLSLCRLKHPNCRIVEVRSVLTSQPFCRFLCTSAVSSKDKHWMMFGAGGANQ